MTNADIKTMISDMVNDVDVLNRIIILEGDEFADGFVGLTIDNHAVYSFERLVKSLCNANADWSELDAIDWLDYNTIRALPYMSSEGNVPVIIHEFSN